MKNRKISTGLLSLLAAVALLTFSPLSLAEKVKLKPLPDKLGKHGLVVMQVGPHHKWHDAEVRLAKGKKGKAHDGFFVRKLRPGKYTLKSVKRLSGSGSNITQTILYYDILPINREFEIKAGKITHLGLQYLLENPENDKAKKEPGEDKGEFFALAFENKDSVHSFLAEYYPGLAKNIGPDDVISDPHEYANEKLPLVREILVTLSARDALKAQQEGADRTGLMAYSPVNITESEYIVGDLGLVARAGSNGKLEYLTTNTVDRIAQVVFSKDQPWFYSSTGNIYRLAGSQLELVESKPADFLANSGAMLSDNSLVFTDRRFHFLVSLDNGTSWTKSDHVTLAEKQFVDASFSQGMGRIFAIANDRAYFFRKSAVAVIDTSDGKVSKLDMPTSRIGKHVSALYDKEAGLFALSNPVGEPTKLFFRAPGSNDWVKNEVSSMFGCTVEFPDNKGKDIFATCGLRNDFALVSRDYGKTWYLRQAAANNQ